MAEVRKRVALPLVGSDIFQVIRPSQNSSQLLDVNLSELYSFITNQFASGFVPVSRTLTINGVTYDLSQDRSWTVSGGIYTADNGITENSPVANNFRLGGGIITPTTITAGVASSSNSIRFDAPINLPTGNGIYYFTGFNLLTTYDPSGNSILGSFDAHGAISLKVSATENAFGPPTVPGTGLFIESKDSLSIPFKIKGTVGDTLLFNNSGQLRLHEYDTSTAFSGVSGSSVGILNVDNQGKVFVTTAPTSTGDSISPFLLMGG